MKNASVKRKRTRPSVHLGVRIPDDLLKRIDAASPKISPPGTKLDRTQTVRALLTNALDVLDGKEGAQ